MPTIDLVLPIVSELVRSVVRGHFELSPAPRQGNLNYTYLLAPLNGSTPTHVVKVKNRAEFEHPISRVLSAPYEKELMVLAECKEKGVSAPEPHGAVMKISRKVHGQGPFVAFVQTFLPGVSGHEIAPRKSAGEIPLLEKVGAVARRIHTIRFSRFGDTRSVHSDFTKSWGAYIDAMARYAVKAIPAHLSARELNIFMGRLSALRARKGEGTLVHADLHLSNALFDPGTHDIRGIIDWERSRSSRPSEELGRILYENFVLGQRFSVEEIAKIIAQSGITPHFASFLKGYEMSHDEYRTAHQQEAETFLSIFCANFWMRWELENKSKRPDWEAPARYAETVVRSIIDNR